MACAPLRRHRQGGRVEQRRRCSTAPCGSSVAQACGEGSARRSPRRPSAARPAAGRAAPAMRAQARDRSAPRSSTTAPGGAMVPRWPAAPHARPAPPAAARARPPGRAGAATRAGLAVLRRAAEVLVAQQRLQVGGRLAQRRHAVVHQRQQLGRRPARAACSSTVDVRPPGHRARDRHRPGARSTKVPRPTRESTRPRFCAST